MPKNEKGELICINCNNEKLVNFNQLTALLPVTMSENNKAVWNSSKNAIFLDAYICRECGYIELYKHGTVD